MYAYGLRLDSAFAIAGLDGAPGDGALRRTRVEVATPADLQDGPEHGYVMAGRGSGRFAIAPDGSRIACAAQRANPWDFQRFLCGRVLPFAAVLQGLEAFRASAVVIDGRVVALASASRSGKTSLAAQLALRGAGFLTDDVLVIEPRPDAVLCHPGAGFATVRNPKLREIARARRGPFRGVIAPGNGSLRVLMERVARPYPLGAIYFLERRGDEIAFQRGDDPSRLLGHTFTAAVRTPERLALQLDSCARVAAAAALVRASVPGWMSAAHLAEAIEAHVCGSVAAAS